jgi:hypothetical protein
MDKRKVFIECGSCGCYHPDDFWGDCRDDENRYALDELPGRAIIISLEEQMEQESRQ